MAVDVWPASLPQRLLQQGYQQGLGDGRARTQPDTGPAKVRRRSSVMPKPLTGMIRMSGAQAIVADDFVETTLIGGSLPFRFPDPLTQVPLLVRFVELPSRSCAGGDWYDLTLSLEILP